MVNVWFAEEPVIGFGLSELTAGPPAGGRPS